MEIVSFCFQIYNIDEFRTSRLYHKNETKGENLYYIDVKKREQLKKKLKNMIKNKNNKDEIEYMKNYINSPENTKRKLHSVLTFKMEITGKKCKFRKDCINRDYNGCLNIRKIFNSYMKDKPRPQRYCRGYNLEKNTNPT